ncbi:hypothetical protein PYCCODRAFT_1444583 [Trametes coccinea BRFM310]|uniref:RNase H type-1 domain-containing protein n=1 Tax=Trametes coccinea (strain BRFM310) TaxID=1353009 RepID=A0A1Y2ITB5_TRAC3|nr:hypothetical protein PYCCODRAFT_1444583 [Trametes coccinea BRFM310]
MDAVTKRKQKYEDEGFIHQKNGELTRAIIGATLARPTHSAFRWVKGHNGDPANEAADSLAGIGAEKATADDVNLEIKPELVLTGVKLSKMSQRLAYRAIRQRKDCTVSIRAKTTQRVARILEDLEDDCGIQVSETQLWKSLKKSYVLREARQWLWMVIHDAYMVGTHWLRPNMSAELQERAMCKQCGQTDSLEHIIFTCTATGRETIWKLLGAMLTAAGQKDVDPTWGSIVGAACVAIRNEAGTRNPIAEERWAILAIESAHLIWKLRCERVIANDGAEFTEREVENRWYAALGRRLDLDRRTAALITGKRKKARTRRIDSTWRPLLNDLECETHEWVVDGGVLVGIKRGR